MDPPCLGPLITLSARGYADCSKQLKKLLFYVYGCGLSSAIKWRNNEDRCRASMLLKSVPMIHLYGHLSDESLLVHPRNKAR